MSTMIFGNGLRRVLAEASLTQTDLAEALGVTRQTVNAWTTPDPNRRKNPSEGMRERIAGYLGVQVADIEKAGRADQPDLEPYQRGDSAAKTQLQNAQRAFSRRLREHCSKRLRYVQRRVEFPGFAAQVFDYADSALAVVMLHRPGKLDRVYQALWQLYKSRVLAEQMGVERRAVLAIVGEKAAAVDTYAAEADIAGVELVHVETPEQLADWVVANSPGI